MLVVHESSKKTRDAAQHKARFERWKNKLHPSSRFLIDLVLDQIVPIVVDRGYIWVGRGYDGDDSLVTAQEIRFEKIDKSFIYCLLVNFEKYGSARFQIHLLKSYRNTHEVLLRANIVDKSYKYLYFWGKAAWMPDFLWSSGSSKKVVSQLCLYMDEAFNFLERGIRNKHIGRSYQSGIR